MLALENGCKMKIGMKIMSGFAVILVFLTVLGIVVLFNVSNMNRQFEFVVEHDARVIAVAQELRKLVVDMETGQRGFLITQKDQFLEPYFRGHDKFNKLITEEKELVSDNPSQLKALEKIETLVDKWIILAADPEIAVARKIALADVSEIADREETNKHMEALRDNVAALLIAGTGKDILDQIRGEFSKFIKVEEDLTAERQANAAASFLTTRNVTISIMVASLILGGLIAILITRVITRPVHKLVDAATSIGKGDLDTEVKIKSRDEVGELAVSFNQMVENLKEYQNKLLLAKEYAENIVETVREPLVVLDSKLCVVSANKSFYSVFKVLPEETEGYMFFEFGNRQFDIPELRGLLEEIIPEKGVLVDYEIEHNFKSIGEKVMLLNARQIICEEEEEEEEGGLILLTIEDITARKDVENRLKESLEQNRAWLDNSPVCTKVVDLDFNLLYMSAAGIKALKIDDVTKLYGTPYPFDFFPEAFKDSMTKNLEKVKETGEVITGEAPVCDIEGNELWFQATIMPVRDIEGRLDYIIIISVDINERKKMEGVLLQSEKLKAMGTVTAGIAHDFNNILAVISGTTQVLELNNEDNEKLMAGLRTIHKVSKDGAEIVRRMREATKLECDTSALQPVNIKSVLEQAIEFARPRWMNIAKASGIDYDIDVDSIMELPTVMGIEVELREVFTNIINNSMDAMCSGGCLSFRTWVNRGDLFISISDTGEGMSDEVKERVFEPFYTTKRAKGTGLGMSVSYSIMKRHNGSIEVKSKEGKGTTFTLRIPFTALPAQQTELTVEHPEIKAKDLSILVVDDNEEIHSFLETFFIDSGHKAKSVDSGESAIDVLKAETFDLVLCDIVMPGMSGYEVAEVLNRMEERPKIGIMTGWSEKITAKEENELNIDFTIKKPFELSDLVGHINDAFGLGSKS